jgi:hypothetical protein
MKSLHVALADLKPERIFVVCPGKEAYALHERVEALPLIQPASSKTAPSVLHTR